MSKHLPILSCVKHPISTQPVFRLGGIESYREARAAYAPRHNSQVNDPTFTERIVWFSGVLCPLGDQAKSCVIPLFLSKLTLRYYTEIKVGRNNGGVALKLDEREMGEPSGQNVFVPARN
ncbi:hypothetical protein BaRGS_00039719 [Batillaria attramentaria]|uniref:Uncharacterized protein n=1 Tax=Batillaria attramentaria TaxID=370345 RepID=A0ABD0J2H0_9CAEN